MFETIVPETDLNKVSFYEAETLDNMETSTTPTQDHETAPQLKRTKRCVDSLDRASESPPHTERPLSRKSKSKSPSVASEADYKEWFGKFNSNDSPDLTVPETDEYLGEEEIQLELSDDPKSQETTTYIKVSKKNNDIVTNGNEQVPSNEENSDVSVSVTMNLNQKISIHETHPLVPTLTVKTTNFLEIERQVEDNNRISIQPSSNHDHNNFVSYLHPEEFPLAQEIKHREPHDHHIHVHNVGYSEWMKKFVDHQSSHLAMSDSSSDSDGPLNETDCLPRFKAEPKRKRKINKMQAQPVTSNLQINKNDSLCPDNNRSPSPRARSPIDPKIDYFRLS